MTPAVRNHLMQVLADAGIPENLLAELMKERRGLRDSIIQAALPAVIARADQGPHQFVAIAKDAYAIADAVLSLRDRSPSYKPTPSGNDLMPMDPEVLKKLRVEEKAKEIYNSWALMPGFVPWVDGGNSKQQEKARDQASYRLRSPS